MPGAETGFLEWYVLRPRNVGTAFACFDIRQSTDSLNFFVDFNFFVAICNFHNIEILLVLYHTRWLPAPMAAELSVPFDLRRH